MTVLFSNIKYPYISHDLCLVKEEYFSHVKLSQIISHAILSVLSVPKISIKHYYILHMIKTISPGRLFEGWMALSTG